MKVTFIGATDEQVRWGGNADPRLTLDAGKEYEAQRVEVHSFHSKIWLKDFGGPYNSVCFEPDVGCRRIKIKRS